MRRRRGIAVTLFALSGAALLAQARGPRQQASLIPAISVTGRVIDAMTNEPIVNARVGSTSDSVGAAAVLTDGTGRFTLMAPQRSLLSVSKAGFGARTISALGRVEDVLLQRSSAISGRVIDDNGDPVIGARVSLEPFPIPDRPGQFLLDASTDDRGEYRLGGFAPGRYAVSLLLRNNQTTTRLFHPGVTDYREAREIRLAAGDEAGSIDFVVSAALANQQLRVSVFGIDAREVQGGQSRGIVRGQVVGPDGRPLARAQVVLMDRSVPPQQFQTNSDGRFQFTGLSAGRIGLLVSKVGFFPSTPDGVNQRAFDLAEGEVHEGVVIRLAPWSAIEGHVFDEHGEPIANAAVQPLQVQYERGRRGLVGAGPTARSNDRGEYRLYAIAGGQYVMSASIGQVSTGDVPGYARSYYPGTPDAATAQYVTVGPGESVSSIDIALARVTTARVSGRMIDSNGQPTQGGSVQLVPSRSSLLALSVGARIERDGRVEFPNVSPGSYVIQVSRGMLNSWTEGEFAAVPVTVANTDVTDILVQTSRGTHITGRVVFEGAATAVPRSVGGLAIRPIAANPDLCPNQAATARLLNDWTFELIGITGPRRLQVVRTPPGWALESVRVGGIDVTDRPLVFGDATPTLDDLEITLTDRISTLQATVLDAASKAVPGRVVVFSSDRDDWYPESRFVRTAASSITQPAVIEGLPSGSYYAVVLDNDVTRDAPWQDPAYLESLVPRASIVTVRAASTTAVRLKF